MEVTGLLTTELQEAREPYVCGAVAFFSAPVGSCQVTHSTQGSSFAFPEYWLYLTPWASLAEKQGSQAGLGVQPWGGESLGKAAGVEVPRGRQRQRGREGSWHAEQGPR